MMKKLLYIFALALFVTSCSVDSINNDDFNSQDELNTRSVKADASCSVAYLVNEKGVYRGTIESFVNHKTGWLTIRYKTKYWKISDAKMFFGPVSQIDTQQPDIFASGKYVQTETFNDDIYLADFNFAIDDINGIYCLMPKLIIKNGKIKETIFVEGIQLPDSDMSYAPEFAKECLQKQ
ncbi:MAG: hypothetical protein HKN00_02750 [Flavobacteriaceae bacterium]|nr:hypothetical protein [Bacteroidia bacterium]MBT8288894.1 hypothetical protein [Bacteroidia bacterium]NNF74077.1 hypothetical protein [Flavobacteriaceae bacterium]NNK73565.1 hypothetical protein [Flavobacteriaceae bacterium]